MIPSILEQAFIAFPLIIGAYLSLSLLKLPDFSIESAYLFGAVAAFLAKDLPLPLIVLSAMGGGMLVGMLVSFLNQILRIPFLLAAIVVNGFCHGMTQYCLGTSIKSFQLTIILPEFILLLVTALALFFIFNFIIHSQLGYSWAIYGNNPLFFRNHSLSERYVVFSGVMAAHGCAGIGGFLFAQANGFVDLTMNVGVILLCLTAIMMGKFFLPVRHLTLLIPLVGIIAFFILQQSLLRMGFNLKYFNAFQALFILIILFINHRKQADKLDHLGV